ncbi:LysR family transcriptional regulator [Novosphingobium guangzhouense]|uniref:HTH lysR-type domain-containing protein n=1 Tax=Novosphingobium guangzhouense TaxID=1850347 RepID=A0A2K2G5W4_9SPHN|nr:LysR family transcriptional regulator [Novosphingobium guangzhouense]PNU06421.1 hypothetical protein A8V01_02395 [Novosphingobium guangzhouense]
MGQLDSLIDIRIFEAVARLRSMSLAARDLDLSVNYISKHLKRLEDQVGHRLLNRTTRQLSLTAEGQALFDQAIPILDGAGRAEEAMDGPGAKPRGTLRVTCTNGLGQWQIAPRLTRFLARYPEVQVHLLVTDEIVDLVADGIDLAIRQAEGVDSSMITRRLVPDAHWICASPDYLAQFGTPTQPEDLAGHRCLVQDNASRDSWTLSDGKETRRVKVPVALLSRSGAVTHAAALAGVGLAKLSAWELLDDVAAGRLVRVLPQWKGAPHSIQIVYPARDWQPRRLKAFVDFIQNEFHATLAQLGDGFTF